MRYIRSIVLVCCLVLVAESVRAQPAKIRIGWQTTWATQGQLALILKDTQILSEHNLAGEFVGFPYGGPLNEAALANQVDVVLTADQPALTLMSKSKDWMVIGRLMYNSGSLVAPIQSKIHSTSDLKGATIGVPFVAAVHRLLVDLELRAGLKPGETVVNRNIGFAELMALAQGPVQDGAWGEIHAVMVWDPAPYILERKKLAKIVDSGEIVSLVLMRKAASNNPEVAKSFMAALGDAYAYFRKNRSSANKLFSSYAKLEIDESVLDRSAVMEPNLTTDKVRVTLSTEDIQRLSRVETFMLENHLIEAPVNIVNRIAATALETSRN